MKKQEEEQLEAQSGPMREYLMEHIMPTLSQGLIECCRAQPQDPVDFLVFHSPSIFTWMLASASTDLNHDDAFFFFFAFQAEHLLKNSPF